MFYHSCSSQILTNPLLCYQACSTMTTSKSTRILVMLLKQSMLIKFYNFALRITHPVDIPQDKQTFLVNFNLINGQCLAIWVGNSTKHHIITVMPLMFSLSLSLQDCEWSSLNSKRLWQRSSMPKRKKKMWRNLTSNEIMETCKMWETANFMLSPNTNKAVTVWAMNLFNSELVSHLWNH